MALMRDRSRAQMALEIIGRDIDEFQVVRFRGQEGLSQLYRFEIDLAAVEQGLALENLVGKPAVLSINTPAGERWFHGVIARFEMTGETHDQTYFRAELVPAVWLLTHRYNSRIFQGKSIKEIITDVLTQGGIPTDRFNMEKLTREYPPREYCVQYRETDYNFISRLMEEEGIWWCFEQLKDKHVLIMGEKAADYVPIPGDAKLRYAPPTGMNVEEEHVYRFRISQSVRPGAVVLNDFNFENPKLNLEAKADNARDPGLVFSDYPGEYTEQKRGNDLAKFRAEEFETSRITALGQSNCKRLAPGKTFDLTEHPSKDFNASFLVTSVTHQGKQSVTRTTGGGNNRGSILDGRIHQALIAARNNDNPSIRELAEGLLQVEGRLRAGDPTSNRALTQWLYHAGQVSKDLPSTAAASGGSPLEWLSIPNLISDLAQSSVVDFDAPVYDCRFECVPASVTFRPPRVTPWPVMRGTQTARVVGPDNEEIHVDKFGRVKVQFNWDLQGAEAGSPKLFGADSSCFVRVCQGSAGGQYGIMFIPRVGQEVVVDFLEGNPDKPIIIGRVYNADHMPPYELPKHKTRSVIKTHSTKGGGGCNEIRFEDLKDKEQLFLQAERQMDTRVKASHFHTVGGSYHMIVGGEKDGELSGEYRQLVHKAKHVHIKGHQRAWIEGNEDLIVDGLQHTKVGTDRTLLVGGDDLRVVEKNHKSEVTLTSHLSATDVKIEATGTIELSSGGNSIVICPAGVYIMGTMVYINSGPGPTVPPVELYAAYGEPEEASAADISQPGKDTRYTGPGRRKDLPSLPEVPGHEFKATFIDILMIDDQGQPVIGEPFEVITPNGETTHGVTGTDGKAHLEIPTDGICQVSFMRLDATVWEKIS